MNCRFCKNSKFIKHFVSTNENTQYSICENCGCHNKSDNKKYNYDDSNNYWVNTKDPDGKIRNMHSEEEKKFKLKNWYGNIHNFINSYNNPKVLDLGCGLGYLLSSLNTKYKFGLEPSRYACDTIKKNYKDIKIFNLNSDAINEIEETFDIIVAYHVIEHVIDPVKFIQNIKLKLKNSGKVIIGTPLIGGLISNYFGKNYRIYNKGHEILFNMKSLKYLHNNNNLKITKIEKPYFKTDYFNFENIMRLFNNKKISPPFYGSIVTIYSENI
jgi:2-polyprenyl-3-methyl-5-hydroxy-6-metoxy-1,4-benzoquinol methylase